MHGRGGDERGSTRDPDTAIPLADIPLHSTTLLSLLDAEGTIRYQSPSIERLCSFDQEELVGIHCTDCFHPDDRDRVYAAFEAVVSTTEFVVEAIEYRHLTADGSYIWVESVASSNPTADGLYVINTRDISVRKQQQTELERANERLKEFASLVSHDLRNPLAVAQGYLELAENECPSDHHERISVALDRMEALIDSLLVNARAELHGITLESVDLARLAETCWGSVVTKDATLHTEIERPIAGDPQQLSRLLENLFRNSLDHGSDAVVVTVGEHDDGFFVEDDGDGIPADVRERMFESGYTTSARGTGLGLAIVEQVAATHGWDVRMTDGRSGGARFEFGGVEFDP